MLRFRLAWVLALASGLAPLGARAQCPDLDAYLGGLDEAAMALGADGRPVIVRTGAPAGAARLYVRRWDGAQWSESEVQATPDQVHRGRMSRATLGDGSLVFCATRRRVSAMATLLEADLRVPGVLDLVHVKADGRVVIHALGPAMALGCGLAASPDGSALSVVYAGANTADMATPVVRLATCALEDEALACRAAPAWPAAIDGVRALGMEPDVAYGADGARLVIGRGLVRAGRTELGAVWLVRVARDGRVSSRVVVDAVSDGARSLAGGASPRLVRAGDAVGWLAVEHGARLPASGASLRRVLRWHAIEGSVAVDIGPPWELAEPPVVPETLRTFTAEDGLRVPYDVIGHADGRIDVVLARPGAITVATLLDGRLDRARELAREPGAPDLVFAASRGSELAVAYVRSVAGSTESVRYVERSERCARTQSTLPAARLALTPPRLPARSDPVGGWSSVRTPSRIEAHHGALASALVCVANHEAETLGAVQDAPFARDVRLPVFGALLSLASNVRPRDTGAAVLVSRTASLDAELPAGVLRGRANGHAFEVDVSRGSYASVARELDAQLAPRGVHADVQPLVDARGAVRSQRLVLSADARRGGAELVVRSSALSDAAGFPVERVSRPTGLDAANGDARGRFRACLAHEPCVPGPGGTCDLPEDCLDADRSLASQLLEGVRLSPGRPPLRTQKLVCVPSAQRGAAIDVCDPHAPIAHRGGTVASHPSFVTAARAPDGACPVGALGTQCETCGDPSRAAIDAYDEEAPREGVVRRCVRDTDCNAGRAPDSASWRYRDGEFLCTHVDRPFLGVPTGAGFCARPTRCAAGTEGARDRVVPGGAHLTLCPAAPDGPQPAAESDFVPDLGDGTAGHFECMLAGCAECIGATANGYCFEDTDCPASHVCATTRADLPRRGSPLCIARPLLEDGRLRDVERRLAGHVEQTSPYSPLARQLVPALQRFRRDARNAMRSFGVPLRVPGHVHSGAVDVDVLVTNVDAQLDGVDVRWEPAEEPSTPGFGETGDLLVDLLLAPRTGATEHGTVRVDALATGSVPFGAGFNERVTALLDVRAVRIRMRPRIAAPDQPGPRVRFEVLSATLLHTREPDVAFGPEHLRIGISGVADVVAGLFTARLFEEVERAVRELGLVQLGEGVTALAGTLLDDAFVGGAFFGAPESSLALALPEGASLASRFVAARAPRAVDAHVGPGGLVVDYDGPRTQTSILFQAARTLLVPDTESDLCCLLREPAGHPEPSPMCLEREGETEATCEARAAAVCGL